MSEIVALTQRSIASKISFGQTRILPDGDADIDVKLGQSEPVDEQDNNLNAHGNFSSRMADILQGRASEIDDLSRFGGDPIRPRRMIKIDVNENTNLFLGPGAIYSIVFDVTSYYTEPKRFELNIESARLGILRLEPNV